MSLKSILILKKTYNDKIAPDMNKRKLKHFGLFFRLNYLPYISTSIFQFSLWPHVILIYGAVNNKDIALK